jgi:uncharacterized membrane protein
MILLYTGLALFFVAHLVPSALPGPMHRVRTALGEGPAKGLVALPVLAGLVLTVLGWRSAVPTGIYSPPTVLRLPALLLMIVAVWLMVVASRPSAVKRLLRHPQLTGVLLWSVAHLMANGDARSVALFGGFALWSVLEMLLINRRDGSYTAPPAPPLQTDVITAVIAVVVFLVLVAAHPWLAGVPLTPPH